MCCVLYASLNQYVEWQGIRRSQIVEHVTADHLFHAMVTTTNRLRFDRRSTPVRVQFDRAATVVRYGLHVRGRVKLLSAAVKRYT